MRSSGLHYPHGTIESTGHSISGHAQTLHNAASSASGITLPSGSLGSIGSSHASTLQSHIGGVSGHISAIAQREDGHGTNLVQNAKNMLATDTDHAKAFDGISDKQPLRITNGPGGVIGGRMPVGEQSGMDKLKAGASGSTRTPGLTAQKMAGNAKRQQDIAKTTPEAPPQKAPGTTEVPLEAHHHMGGEVNKKKKPVGGHVAANDYQGFNNYNNPAWKKPLPTSKLNPAPTAHGHGIVGATPKGPTSPNGVYTVSNGTISDGANGTLNKPGNTPYTKPISTMFPQGVPAGQVWGMGEQAWNGGQPHGGMSGGQWSGHAQVPYTPVWNPTGDHSLPAHGSGDGNNPHAGQVVNIQGFHRPMDSNNPTVEHPASYFPQPPAQQPTPPPPAATDPNWVEAQPKRDYGDPNYKNMP
jgi:hypothetical protein